MRKILIITNLLPHFIRTLDQDYSRNIQTLKTILKRYGNRAVVVEFNRDAHQLLKQYGVPCKTPDDYNFEHDHREDMDDAMELVEKIGRIRDPAVFGQAVRYKNFNLWDLASFEIYDMHVLKLVKYFKILRYIINEEEPDQVIVFRDDIIPRSSVNLGFLSQLLPGYLAEALAHKNKIPVRVIRGSRGLRFKYFISDLYFRYNDLKRQKEIQKRPTIDVAGQKQSSKKPKKKILLLAYSNTDEIIFKEILNELSLDGSFDHKVIAVEGDRYGDLGKNLRGENIDFSNFFDHMDGRTADVIRSMRKSLIDQWDRIKTSEELKQQLHFEEVNLWDTLENGLEFLIKVRFAEIIGYIELSYNIMSSEGPDIVIVGNQVPAIGKTVVSVARSEHIPTLTVQHGILENNYAQTPVTSNKFAVWGKADRDLLTGTGISPDKLEITGNIKYDAVYRKKMKFDSTKIRKELKIDKDKNLVLFATNPIGPEHNERLFRSLLEAVGDMRNVQLVVKIHPHENFELYNNILRDVGTKTTVIRDIDIFEILSAADLVITLSSTVGLDAMILEKPLIILNLLDFPDSYGYESSGAARTVKNSADIRSAIMDLIDNPESRKKLKKNQTRFIIDRAYKVDGHVASRILNLIKQMTS